MSKLDFIKNEFPKLLEGLNPDAKGKWGVLNGQQMVEHMSWSVKIATGKEQHKILTPPDKLEKAKEFAMSDKEFKENTKNSTMPDMPTPVKNKNMQGAITEFKNEVQDFITYFEKHKGETLPNPFFGNLNFEEWTQLFYKHVRHHSRQFGLI